MKPTNSHSLASLGDKLRTRYDDAFVRAEVTNLRQQVTVLHDTVLAFITKVDKCLSAQEEVQKNLSARVTRLEHVANLKPLPTSMSQRRQHGGASSSKSAPGDVVGVIMDEQGNYANLVAIESNGTEGEEDDNVMLTSTLPDEGLEEASVKEENDDDMNGGDEPDDDHSGDIQFGGTGAGRPSAGSMTRHRPHTICKPEEVDWEALAAESKKMISLPERKGKGGKVSGRLGQGSPAWTHFLRTAMHRSLGDLAMFRYAREGSRVFRNEKETEFSDIKGHVVDFCKENDLIPPEDKLMDEIAWAFLRNKKRYRAKVM